MLSPSTDPLPTALTQIVQVMMVVDPSLSTPFWEFLVHALFENYLCLSLKTFMNIVRTIVGTSHSQAMSVLMRKS